MDKRVRNVTALGLLTIVAVVTLIWGAYYLMGTPFWKNGLEVAVLLDNGAGLKRGDRVQLQGVQVGTVRSVGLTESNDVMAVVRLNDQLTLPVDTRATVTGDVFGAHTVDLFPGASLLRLEKGDTIRGGTTPQLTSLAADLSAQAGRVLTSADSLLSPKVVGDLQQTAAVLPATARELRAAFVELRLAATALKQTGEEFASARTGEAVNNALGEMQHSAQALTAAATSMERSLDTFTSVLAKIDEGQGTLGRLVNDSTLYLEFHQTLREMGALATDIRERPQRYINLRVF